MTVERHVSYVEIGDTCTNRTSDLCAFSSLYTSYVHFLMLQYLHGKRENCLLKIPWSSGLHTGFQCFLWGPGYDSGRVNIKILTFQYKCLWYSCNFQFPQYKCKFLSIEYENPFLCHLHWGITKSKKKNCFYSVATFWHICEEQTEL